MKMKVKVCCRGGRENSVIEAPLENIMLVDFRSLGTNPLLLQVVAEKAEKQGRFVLFGADSIQSLEITNEE